MAYTTPISFVEALVRHDSRVLFPTGMTTQELQQLGGDVLRRSLFSAQVMYENHLKNLGAAVRSVLDPVRVQRADGPATVGLNLAKARELMKDSLMREGYFPKPDVAGTILDFSSDQRINLQIKTLTQTAQGEGWWVQGQDEAVLDEWPAQELYRAVARKQERDWSMRFRLAGEASGSPIGTGWTMTPDGRLVALKNHPIWDRLGDPALFPDGLGNPWPPFAFSSGMRTKDVGREDAEGMGLIAAGGKVEPRNVETLTGGS